MISIVVLQTLYRSSLGMLEADASGYADAIRWRLVRRSIGFVVWFRVVAVAGDQEPLPR
jgi:hypothetical protein